MTGRDNARQWSLMTMAMATDIAFRRLSVDAAIGVAKDAGIQHVDLFDLELLLYGRRRTERALARHDVTISCLIASVSFLTKSEHAVEARLQKVLRTAHDLGVSRIMIVPGDVILGSTKIRLLDRDTKIDRYARGFAHAVELGAEWGIEILLEDTPIIAASLSTGQDCKDLLDRVPGLGLVFDTANMIVGGDEALNFHELLQDRITYVHLKDVAVSAGTLGDRTVDGRRLVVCRWGDGIVPIADVLDRLDADGYRGPIAIEYAFPGKSGRADDHDRELAAYLSYVAA